MSMQERLVTGQSRDTCPSSHTACSGVKTFSDRLHSLEVRNSETTDGCFPLHALALGWGLPCLCFLPGATSPQLCQPKGPHENPQIHLGHTKLSFWKVQRLVLAQMILLKWDREHCVWLPPSATWWEWRASNHQLMGKRQRCLWFRQHSQNQ